jgi:hypothetical protein
MWAVPFSGDELSQYTQIDFTRRYAAAWEGIDHCVLIDHAPVEQLLEPDAERSS